MSCEYAQTGSMVENNVDTCGLLIESEVHFRRVFAASCSLPSKLPISYLRLIHSMVMMHVMFIIDTMPEYDMRAVFKTRMPANPHVVMTEKWKTPANT